MQIGVSMKLKYKQFESCWLSNLKGHIYSLKATCLYPGGIRFQDLYREDTTRPSHHRAAHNFLIGRKDTIVCMP
jgi:hypothetical protein